MIRASGTPSTRELTVDEFKHLPRSERAAAGVICPPVPGHNIDVNPGGWQHWRMFDTPEERQQAISETFLTWAPQGDDRFVLLNYALTWRDVNGYGLHLAHSDWAGRHGHLN